MAAMFFSILTGLAWAIPHPSSSTTPRAAPVFLRSTSAVPTGHYNVNYLRENLIGQEKIKWVYVKRVSDGVVGWTPKPALLTPLHFATKARLLAHSPIRRDLKDLQPDPTLSPKHETTVDILDVQGEWVLISHNSQAVWAPFSHLFALEKDPGYFFLKSSQFLRDKAQVKARFLTKIPAGERLKPLAVQKEWVKVAVGQHKGFVPFSEIISRLDIATKVKTESGFETGGSALLRKNIYAIFVNPLWLGTAAQPAPLYENPSTSSALLARVQPWDQLIQQDAVEQEWGVSKISELGQVWWEFAEEQNDPTPMVRLPMEGVKKVMSNPTFKHLKVATAGGLYRGTDGVYWAPIRGFQGYNPPFTYAKDGVLFVEDKISFDNGEHFTPFVFWESLFDSLRNNGTGLVAKTKIIRLESLNNSSRELIMEVDVGASRPIQAYTSDRGQNWSILKR